MSDTAEVKRLFGAFIADEPPFEPDVERVIARAVRHRRHRAATRVAVAASTVAIVSVLIAGFPRGAADRQRSTPALSLLSFATGADGTPGANANDGSASETLESLLPTIEANSPDALEFDLSAMELTGGELLIGGTVDDGKGDGRIFVALSSEAGSTTLNPCSDDEFHQGASCDVEILRDGARLVRRGEVAFEGAKTLAVVLIRPDGSGIYAEAGNWSPSEAPPRPVKEGEPQDDVGPVSITRQEPAYTIEQLATLIQAIDTEI